MRSRQRTAYELSQSQVTTPQAVVSIFWRSTNMVHGSGLESPFMTNQGLLPPNEVGSAYEALLEAFRDAVENANLKISFPPRPVRNCFMQTADQDTAMFEES